VGSCFKNYAHLRMAAASLRLNCGHAKHLFNSCAARPGARAVAGRRTRTGAQSIPPMGTRQARPGAPAPAAM